MGERDYRGSERFEVIRRIGHGGMGIVYEVVDRERNDRLALKMLRVASADSVLRFKNEFRHLQGIEHPNIVGLTELIAEGDRWLLAMELIQGVDFLSWVRPAAPGAAAAPSADDDTAVAAPLTPGAGAPGQARPIGSAAAGHLEVERVRGALAQLASGLAVLHGNGMVHRDIKPSNILVTPAGRVVILDFGLVTLCGAGEAHVVGTTAYMAPEQAASQAVGPAADWYSVGVLLYEALAGQLPFAGTPLAVLAAKQRELPPRPRALAADVPEDLDELCMELLAIDPAERPGVQEVLARISSGTAGEPTASGSTRRPPFIGRVAELSELHAAFAAACRGTPQVVVVEGPSGVGKSALVRVFLDEIAAEAPTAVVLAGRCYERESVPFKAVDGVVDALAGHLGGLPERDCGPLLPRHVGALARLFPVLIGIDAIAHAQGSAADTADRQELRMRAFSALRELLARIGDRAPLVVAIDDLQWADADSAALLGEVLAPPCAPVLLLVATARTGGAGALPGARRVELAALAPAEAEELSRQLLLRAAGATTVSAAAIAAEAAGHPMFIDELVRNVAEGSAPAALRLDDAIAARVGRLEDGAQRVLEVCAVHGGPLDQETVARAAGCSLGELGRHARVLVVANLARTAGARGRDTMEPYHDRVREAVLASMPPAARAACHLRLARTLEASGRADPEALAEHYRGAGDHERAAEHAVAAAAQAAAAFAFDRAARLYGLALALAPEHPRARELRAALGDALANAGRGGEAAAAFLAALPAPTAAETLDLKRRAAEQYLVSGHIDEGMAVVVDVMGALGMRWPATPRRALASTLWGRTRLRLRGLGFTPRDQSQVPAAELTRIDVCYALSAVIGIVDNVRGADFQTRHLLLALRAGEPFRVARALSVEVAFLACAGGGAERRARRVLDLMHATAQPLDDPFLRGVEVAERGVLDAMLGRWRSAAEQLHAGETMLRDRCRGVSYEIGICEFLRFCALSYLGDVDVIARDLPAAQRAALDRGDRLAASNLHSAFLVLYWLAADDPAGARRAADDAIATWSRAGFHLQHYNDLLAQVAIDLYAGDPATAIRRCEDTWPALEASMLLYIQQMLIEVMSLRGRAAVAAAAATSSAADRARWLRLAGKCAARIDGTGMAWGRPLAELLRAGAAGVRGHADEARQRLEAALPALEATDMHLFAAAVRRTLGLLRGAAGASTVAAAERWMADKGIVAPAPMTALHVPGFALPTPPRGVSATG